MYLHCSDFCTLLQLQEQERIFLNMCCVFKSCILVLYFLHIVHVIAPIIIKPVCVHAHTIL